MKIRESGMPDASLWSTFFDIEKVLDQLGVNEKIANLVDFGCGYGHFSVAAAKRISGLVSALDIEVDMIASVQQRAKTQGVDNIHCQTRDFLVQGSGLKDASQDYAMIFNLLHLENPIDLLSEARRVLTHNGQIGIIHWNHDPETPRGPPMHIRPRPEQCLDWLKASGLVPTTSRPIDLPPYHYGWVATNKG